jgi:hypothetical protein
MVTDAYTGDVYKFEQINCFDLTLLWQYEVF